MTDPYEPIMRSDCEKEKQELIEELLKDYEEIRNVLEGISIPYNIIIKIDSLKEKYEKRLKQ